MRVRYDADGNPIIDRESQREEPDREKKIPHKFYDIPYLKAELLNIFLPTDEVWIEEKIDGSNTSCEIDEHGKFRCYGRKWELGEWYTNMGAYQKLLALEATIREHVSPNIMLYFEYLSLHHVRYSADKENGIYLIGARDKQSDKYLTPDKVYEIAASIGVETPACLYHGQFKDWSIAESLVGTSKFGAKKGEGVIVKAYDQKCGIRMVKLVTDDFREIMKYDPARIQAKIDEERKKTELAKQVVTEARIRKQLYTMRDEGIIQTVDGMTPDEKTIAIKNIGKLIYHDCIKEEIDFVLKFGKDFGKYSFMLSKKYIQQLD